MKTSRFWAVGLVVIVVALTAASAPVQEAAPVTLTLRLAGDRNQFRPGEVIPIELEFNSRIAKRFVVDGATYDRSGRLTIDEFRVEPLRGVTDPMLDYLASIGGFIGGGLRGMHALGERPATVKLDLNDWFRFDEPGRYQLTVHSRRAIDESAAQPFTVVPVASNTISIEILARDPAWEAALAATLAQRADRPPSRDDPREACRALRFLGSRAAVDEMIRRFGLRECNFDFVTGLYGAPDRAYVVREMTARLAASDQPVDASYLRTLATLSVYLEHPELRAPQTAETMGRMKASGEILKHRDWVDAAYAKYRSVAMEALAAREPGPRALQIASALESATDPAERDELRERLAAVFLDLPVERQAEWLEFRWPVLSTQALLPALRTLADAPQRGRTVHPQNRAADIALRRLHALAPEDARPRILAQIRNPPAGATIRTLGLLPDAELPELDDALAANVERGRGDLSIALVQRYASAAVAPRVLRVYADRVERMACEPQASFMAYLMRVDAARGQELLERALASRAPTRCFTAVLLGTARLRMSPAIETAAIRSLEDPEAELVLNAVETLGQFGSPAGREPLRAAFERWHKTWAGRQDELRYKHTDPRPDISPTLVETAFVRALAQAASWHATAAEIRALVPLCVTESCRQETESFAASAGAMAIAVFPGIDAGEVSISLAQYRLTSIDALGRKLAQYPRGTAFTLSFVLQDPRAEAAIRARITALAEERGMSIR